jgi:hypothetical protein
MSYVIACDTCGLSLALTIESYLSGEPQGLEHEGTAESGDVVVVEDESECQCNLRQKDLNIYFRKVLEHAQDIW